MTRKKRNGWNSDRYEKGGYVQIPHCVFRSYGFANLSAYASKLLLDLLSQYNGSNNGDFHATFSLMTNRGWKSKGTLNRAIKELVDSGFVELSRQGGRNKCNLFAVTFYAIDECKGKLDISATDKPTSLWRKNEPIPDIALLRKEKQERDDKNLMKELVKRLERL
jgi:hypothetical protein